MMFKFTRFWSMPNGNTFDIPQFGGLIGGLAEAAKVSCDPFARDSELCTWTNDLNPNTSAKYHMEAVEFLDMLCVKGVVVDFLVLDPPYSPRQISECYKSIGRPVTMSDTQNAAFMKRVREASCRILSSDAIVASFGWNSVGMGKEMGFVQCSIDLCCHGSGHNDTICVIEKRAA